MDVSTERYELIVANINKARAAGNKRALKLWRNKLEKWQLAYGAYTPIKIK